MIIRCESCGTRYNLAEEKVLPGGTRVRCARCGAVFMVFPSSSEELPELEIFSEEFGVETELEEGQAAAQREDAETQGTFSLAEKKEAGFEQSSPFDPDDFSLGGDDDPSGASFPRQKSEEFEGLEGDFDLSSDEGFSSAENEPSSVEKDDKSGEVKEDFSPPPLLSSMGGQKGPTDLVYREQKRGGLSLAGRLLLVLVLVVAAVGGGLAGYLFWSGEPLDFSRLSWSARSGKSAPQQPVESIRLTDIEGFFAMNRDAGRLFVIRGQAVNELSEARGAISVKGVLYDATGRPIAQKIAYCGNPLDNEALGVLPMRKIDEAMKNQFGADFSNLTTAPGKSIPFTIVFQNVPDRLAEFSVDVNGSNPATADR